MSEYIPRRPEPRRGPFRRLVKWLAVTVLVCLVTCVAWTVGSRQYARWSGEAELNAVLAELDASDPGWRLDDLLAAREARFPPPDRNPMAVVKEVVPTVPKVWDAWEVEHPNWNEGDPNRRPPSRITAGLTCVRDECRPVIDRFRTLKDMPPGGYHLDIKPNPLATLLPHTQEVRSAAALLRLDATTAALDKDPDRAVTSGHACLAAGRGLGDEPTLISLLVRTAVGMIASRSAERTLGLCEPRAGLADLQAALLAEADAPTLADALRGERALMDRTFEAVDTGTVGIKEVGDDRSRPDVQEAFFFWLYRGKLPADRAYFLNTLTEYIAIARRPVHERLAAMLAVPPPPRDLDHILSRLLLPAIDKVVAADVRVKAHLRAAAVGIACERYRLKTGRWPTALSDLREFLPGLPLDPYTGQPLKLLRRADGLTVYSAGPDGTDHGGKTLTPDGKPGTDLGFRLWDVSHRAADPLPEDKEPIDDM